MNENLAPKDISRLLSPRSVTVIGVSKDKTKLGYRVFKNIIDGGFRGEIYPVNPRGGQINGYVLYKDVHEIDGQIDLALIAIPGKFVPEILRELGARRVKNVIIISAGFKESGKEGAKLENEIKRVAMDYKINLLGPNCLGVISTSSSLNASFASSMPEKGDIVFISQSGALCTSALDWANKNHLGFRDFISIGNKVDIDENILLEYYLHILEKSSSHNISVIVMYLEDFTDGVRFMKVAEKITKLVPIIVLKPGVTDEAQNAISLHTGALAQSDEIIDMALRQAGCIRVFDIASMFKLMRNFSWEKVPAGSNVAIVTNAGGPAIITADMVVDHGLEIAKLTDSTKKALVSVLPRAANVSDPVDVIGDALADRYASALEIVLKEKGIDSVIVLLTPQIMTEIEITAKLIAKLSRTHNKTILATFIGGKDVDRGIEILNQYKIPSFHYPKFAVSTLSLMYKYRVYCDSIRRDYNKSIDISEQNIQRVSEILGVIVDSQRKYASVDEICEIAKSYRIPYVESFVSSSLPELQRRAEKIGYPVVAKIAEENVVHKTDINGVITGIADRKMLRKGYKRIKSLLDGQMMPYYKKRGFIELQKQIIGGYEVFIGCKRDYSFGLVLIFGWGGIYTEVLEDKALRVLPCSSSEYREMIKETLVSKLLLGARGKQKVDLDLLSGLFQSIYLLMRDHDEIEAIDINPCIISKTRIDVVDMKIGVRR